MKDAFSLFADASSPASGREARTPLVINLGAGHDGAGRLPDYFAGWRELRVDVDPDTSPDIVADLTELGEIPSGFGDVVWASHCVEHLYHHEVPAALREMRRILAPQGFACLRVPDLQTVAAFIAQDRMHETIYQSNAGPITAHDVIFGYGGDVARGRHAMAHRTGFTPTVLVNCLKEAGFESFLVRRTKALELVALAPKTMWSGAADPGAILDTLGL